MASDQPLPPPPPDPRLAVHIETLRQSFPGPAAKDAIRAARELLIAERALEFRPYPNGLFAAAAVTEENEYTGYGAVWVRDNVYLAFAHYRTGDLATARRTVETLHEYFDRHRHRFDAVIADPTLADDPMNRPHVRFDGRTLDELPVKWSHAQNDALGYFLWLYCRMARAGDLPAPDDAKLAVLLRFVGYFDAIRYWQDPDSGHWEETRKVSASSIGVAVAGLLELKALLAGRPGADRLDYLIARGTETLATTLPDECAGPAELRRDADGALLFLLYPTGVLRAVFSASVAEQYERAILRNTAEKLSGAYGVRRYVGDSFWCKDYRKKFTEDDRTRDFSDDLSVRDKKLERGTEAQWCIFDPILSAYYGERFARTGDPDDRRRQGEYLIRSLTQVTGPGSPFGPFRCPELYFEEGGQVQPNDATPLLWTQANLLVALQVAEESL